MQSKQSTSCCRKREEGSVNPILSGCLTVLVAAATLLVVVVFVFLTVLVVQMIRELIDGG
jgi:hypothetical protein